MAGCPIVILANSFLSTRQKSVQWDTVQSVQLTKLYTYALHKLNL